MEKSTCAVRAIMKKGSTMQSSTEDQTTPAPLAGRREWLGLLVLVLPSLVLSVDLTVLFLALPHLAQDLQPTATQQLWISDIYGFMIAGLLITMGTLGDRIGRRKLLLIGGGLFGVASILAAYAPTPELLILARALLGIAGATLAPSTLALIPNMFRDPKQRGTAIAVWTTCFMGGGILGPILGGFMLSWFWWGSVFLLAVPVMALLLIAGPKLLPEHRNPEAGRLDLVSVALSLLAIIPFIYGFKEIARNGWEALPVGALVLGVLFGVAFVRRQKRLDDPMLDLGLFKIRTYRNALLLGQVIGIVQGGTLLLINIQLQMVEGLSPLRTGLWLVPAVIGTVLAVSLTNVLARRIKPAYLIAAGLLVSATGFALLATVPSGGGLAMVVAGSFLGSVGIGPTVALGYGMILNSAPPEKMGSASAMAETSGEFGLAAGIAIMGTVGVAVYRGEFTVPDGVPAGLADSARESIANAVVVADQLAPPVAAQLISSARDAFTSGLNAVGVLAAVLAVLLAALALVWFKHVPTTSEAQAAQAQGAGDAEAAAPVSPAVGAEAEREHAHHRS
jgi:DHA2 family multidrug resistance protein-like MFS transporter